MKKLLIVVDYQKDFVDGALGFPGAETLADGIQAKIEAYRAAGDEVVFTFDTHPETYMETQEGSRGGFSGCGVGCRAQHRWGKPAPLAGRRPQKSWVQIRSLCRGRKPSPYPVACFLSRWGCGV